MKISIYLSFAGDQRYGVYEILAEWLKSLYRKGSSRENLDGKPFLVMWGYIAKRDVEDL